MINKNWNRWIFASACAAFKTKLAQIDYTIPFIAEGQNQKLKTDYIELRMNGPTWTQTSLTQYSGDVIINLLVRSHQDEKDFHRIFRLAGSAEASFIPCFSIRKYGDTPDDDASVIVGNLTLQDTVETNHYGQIAPDLPMFESTVEGTYKVDITLDAELVASSTTGGAIQEVPSGVIDGNNMTFTISFPPSPPGSLQVFLNGLLQILGDDYTFSGQTIVFSPTTTPQLSDALYVYYLI